ncbi:MAG: hypothetical protein ACE5E1_05490 [Phycisphaerae bacterium]
MNRRRPPILPLFAVGFVMGPASVAAVPPGHGSHPPMPGQRYYLQCRFEGERKPILIEKPIRLASLAAPAKLDQAVELPEPLAALRLVEYLPQAVLEQRVVHIEAPGARPAVRISVDGPTQSIQRWLIADDAERNRLTSFIATWRYMAVNDEAARDALLDQFKHEFSRPPRLLIGDPDGGQHQAMPAQAGEMRAFEALHCTVRVEKFFSHYAMDESKRQPVNLSDQRINPAALVTIERNGRKEHRWVFAKFPKFGSNKKDTLPLKIVLDCPIDTTRPTPDFCLVTVGKTAHEVWTRNGTTHTQAVLTVGKKVAIPGTRYTFHVRQYEPAGELKETYRPAAVGGGAPALKVRFTAAPARPTELWLRLGKPRIVHTAIGPMSVAFGPRPSRASGGHR